MRKSRSGWVSLLCLVLASCDPAQVSPSGMSQPAPSHISITVFPNEGIERVPIQTDYALIPNCGPGEVEAAIERSWSVRHEVSMEAGIEVNATGEAKLLGTGMNVGAAISAKYGTAYGSEDTIKRTLKFKVKEYTNVRYDFQLVEIWQKGHVEIRSSDQEQRFPYRFRQDFALELTNSQDRRCPAELQSSDAAEASTSSKPEAVSTVPPAQASPMPTSTGRAPWFGPVSFCLEIDADNRCINPATSLPSGTTKLYVSWAFVDIPYGAHFDRIWYYNDKPLKYVDDVWDNAWGSPSGVEFTYYEYLPGLTSGDYRVVLVLDDRVIQSGIVRISQ